MLNQKKQEEIAFNKRYSRFKLQMFFKHRPAITHYGNERTRCTVAQIKFGHISQVLFNREQGLQDCIDRITICEKLYGLYVTAIIYDNKRTTTLENGTVQKGREIRKYVAGELIECEDPFSSDDEKKILTTVKHFEREGIMLFELVPCKPVIDFKKEVEQALQK